MYAAICFIIVFGFGIIIIPYGIWCGLNGREVFKQPNRVDPLQGYVFEHNEPDRPTTPYYIIEEYEAIQEQILIHEALIEHYNNKLYAAIDYETKLKFDKKIVDLKLKKAKLENKSNKLLNTWEGLNNY